MLEYDAALSEVLKRARPRPRETVDFRDALLRVLAADVRARRDIPPFDKSAMDGYAVRAADTAAAQAGSPVTLAVSEDLPAGRVSRRALAAGQAARIMTGAPLPKGADAVVMVEDTERSGRDGVLVRRSARPGDNIGRAGEDVRAGDVVLPKGRLVGPSEVGMLAALGAARVAVVRRPRVAVIATGDEIVEPWENPGPARIRNSNGHALFAQALVAGADVDYLGIARDTPASLRAAVRKARDVDVLVLTGGVSVGDYDLVKDELVGLGVKPVFWKVNIKPGRPTFFGAGGGRLVFGLPGNPTSAMVTFTLFVRPALDRMLAKAEPAPARAAALLDEEIRVKPGRTQFLRGVVKRRGPQLRVAPYANQRSGVLRSMVESGVLIVIPKDVDRVPRDGTVEILELG